MRGLEDQVSDKDSEIERLQEQLTHLTGDFKYNLKVAMLQTGKSSLGQRASCMHCVDLLLQQAEQPIEVAQESRYCEPIGTVRSHYLNFFQCWQNARRVCICGESIVHLCTQMLQHTVLQHLTTMLFTTPHC